MWWERGPQVSSFAESSKDELFYTEEELSEVSHGIPRRTFQGMKELLEAGLMEAGKGVITRTLRSGGSMAADLHEDGRIVCSVRASASPATILTNWMHIVDLKCVH